MDSVGNRQPASGLAPVAPALLRFCSENKETNTSPAGRLSDYPSSMFAISSRLIPRTGFVGSASGFEGAGYSPVTVIC